LREKVLAWYSKRILFTVQPSPLMATYTLTGIAPKFS